jgi:phosphohistidine phosphatase
MKTLYLLRHAKSSWKDDTLLDIERPLNKRGRKAAETMGAFLRKKKIIPDLVLCSTAVRARQTTEIVLEVAKLSPDIHFEDGIYEADPTRLLELVRQIEKSKKAVLLVGHNPRLEEFLEFLTGKKETMSTAALSKIVLRVTNWANVNAHKGTLEWMRKPKALKKK